jgi:hypothetical protein
MKKILSIGIALLTLVACNMDFYRSDTMTSAQLKDDPGAAIYTTDGIYSMFKDVCEYKGEHYSGNTYVRHYFQMSEFRGDNVCLTGQTSDPLCEEMRYSDNDLQRNVNYMWFIAYKIIYAANSNIESITPGASPDSDHLLGENYFFRAIAHFHLVTLYAKPYVAGRDNLGVVLRTSTDCSETHRATVGEVYDQVVEDLKTAAEYLALGTDRGKSDHGYVTAVAAKALLTRVYLYMEKNQECLDLCNEIIGSDPASLLDPDLEHYVANARTSKETLWCVTHIAPEDNQNRSSIGSMYFSPDGTGGTGWGEMTWSDPLMELILRYPQDKRFNAYFHQYAKLDDGKKMIHWPIDDGVNIFRSNAIVAGEGKGIAASADGSYTFNYQNKSYTAKPETDANGYTKYFITYNGAKTQVYVRDNADFARGVRNTFPMYYVSKFSTELEGVLSMISSPVMIRWAEVILNRAEVNAKLGHPAEALKDVNVIRARAGLTGDAQMTESNYKARGYKDVLEVVLDERRMELCFEGHRAFDVYRNRLAMDRRFAGVQTWEVVEWTDNRIPYQLPSDEILTSGVPQNPR